jgi:phage shock protein C
MSERVKKLYRSTKNRMLAGVCGGIAEYFELDPTIIRVILWLLIPQEPEAAEDVAE